MHDHHLDTSIGQIAAQRLYASCGYEEVGHIVQSGVECILYEKRIAIRNEGETDGIR